MRVQQRAMKWRLTQLRQPPLFPTRLAALTQQISSSCTPIASTHSPSASSQPGKPAVTMRRRSLRMAAALAIVQSLLLLVCQVTDAQSSEHGDHDHSHMMHESKGQSPAS